MLTAGWVVRLGGTGGVLLALGFLQPAMLWGQTYQNPLVTPGFPPAGWFTDGPADPCVVEFEGSYYVYPTGNGVSYKVMGSDNLVDWVGDRVAFTIPEGSPWKTHMLWAPEVRYINGRFYLYYTAGLGPFSSQRIGVAESAVPIGPFEDRTYNAPLTTVASIDAFCFQDGDDLYLYYAAVQAPGQPFLSIWVRRMLDPLTLDPAVPATLCISPAGGWEGGVAEGAYVIKRAGRYYMLYSAYGADWPDYAIGVASADHPLGPWTKQPSPFNPVFKRNDAIGLWGPGHGDHVTGPDGISDWHVYHHKINAQQNFKRELALDRLVPLTRNNSRLLRFTSSGGTRLPTPRPRMAHESSNFHDNQLPATFEPVSGLWVAVNKKLLAPLDGSLLIHRPLLPADRQDFQFEWWLRADALFIPDPDSAIEWSLGLASAGDPRRAGFRIRPALATVEFVEVNETTSESDILASASLPPGMNWSSHSRRITLGRNGDRWEFLIDRNPVLSVQYSSSLSTRAWVRTTAMPTWLDGYRQTLRFIDDFESAADTGSRWNFDSGTWSFQPPTAGDDGHLLQSDRTAGRKIALFTGLAPQEFDLRADFCLVTRTAGTPSRHGLIHNYQDAQNYAMVVVNSQRNSLQASAVMGGTAQPWEESSVAMPATYTVNDYHQLALTTDAEAGEFVYSLNGTEMLRRPTAGLPLSGRAGLMSERSEIKVDNFVISGSPPLWSHPADFDSDGDVDQEDFGHLQRCLTGRLVLQHDPDCRNADLDGDGDVDDDDMAAFLGCMSGANVPADPDCANF